MNVVLGIDIAKANFEAALLIDKKFYCKKFGNSQTGFKNLGIWLHSKNVTSLHACMEATGKYSLSLAAWLHLNDFMVSMVNPVKIKGFAQSELSRSKTDRHDAKLIARFCLTMKPDQWKPMPDEVQELREWVDRREDLKNILLQEKNRLEMQDNKGIRKSIESNLAWLATQLLEVEKNIEQTINDKPSLSSKHGLLKSIPGIGDKTSATILAYVATERFNSAKKMAAFIGVNPRQHSSGTSVRGRTRLSKTGNSQLRKSLYMPALTALRYNPVVKRLSKRLDENKKPKMVIVGAAMRKLVHIVYGVLKSNRVFDHAYATI